jgi:hypothetical protein
MYSTFDVRRVLLATVSLHKRALLVAQIHVETFPRFVAALGKA